MPSLNSSGNGSPQKYSNRCTLSNSQSLRPIRKISFGENLDHLQTQEDLEREMRNCHERDKNEHKYDFVREEPINYHHSSCVCSQCCYDTNVPELTANTSQSQSVSLSSKASSPNMSLVLNLWPTSTVCSNGQEVNLSNISINTPKQSMQTTIIGRKSGESKKKRSEAENLSHKDAQTSTKRFRFDCTSTVRIDSSDATDIAVTDDEGVQTVDKLQELLSNKPSKLLKKN